MVQDCKWSTTRISIGSNNVPDLHKWCGGRGRQLHSFLCWSSETNGEAVAEWSACWRGDNGGLDSSLTAGLRFLNIAEWLRLPTCRHHQTNQYFYFVQEEHCGGNMGQASPLTWLPLQTGFAHATDGRGSFKSHLRSLDTSSVGSTQQNIRKMEKGIDWQRLQDISEFYMWSKEWDMEFNVQKYKVMEMGKVAKRRSWNYWIEIFFIARAQKEKYSSMNDLWPDKHVAKTVGKA